MGKPIEISGKNKRNLMDACENGAKGFMLPFDTNRQFILALVEAGIIYRDETHSNYPYNQQFKLTDEGIERLTKSGLLKATPVVPAREEIPATPEPDTISDDPNATLTQVIEVASRQDRVHPRDVSFIMDRLSVRQCRALINHEGFMPDQSLAWAVKIGLVSESGAFTAKGKAFIKAIS